MKMDGLLDEIIEKDLRKNTAILQEELRRVKESVSAIIDLALQGSDTEDEEEFRRVMNIDKIEVVTTQDNMELVGLKCHANITAVFPPTGPAVFIKRLDDDRTKYDKYESDISIISTPKKKFGYLLERAKTVNHYFAHEYMSKPFNDIVESILSDKLKTEYDINVTGTFEYPAAYPGDTRTFGIDFTFTRIIKRSEQYDFRKMVLNIEEDK